MIRILAILAQSGLPRDIFAEWKAVINIGREESPIIIDTARE